jgi:hypothetical protein
MATCGNSMFAYNATTGDMRWNRSGIGCAYDVSEPVVAGGIVYSTTYGNRTLALDAATGETVYDFEMPGCCKGTSPVPYNGRLYVADRYETGEVYAFAGPEWPRLLPGRTLVNESTDLTVLGEYRDEPIPNATLRVDGTTLTTDENGTASYTFDSGGTYDVLVSAPDSDRTDYVETRRTITVGVSGFAVTIDSTSTPSIEGETLQVNATVENTGTTQQTQTITLDAGALGTDSTTVTLAAGSSTDVTLSLGTGAGDAGTYTATVSSADDTATANVTVLSPAEFGVDIVETDTPAEGEQLNVTARIENVGDVSDTQTITLALDGVASDSTSVTLAGNSSTNVTLSADTGAGDAGSRPVTVSSADDAESANVTVLSPANFTLSIVETNTPVEGETLDVTARVENTGDVEDLEGLVVPGGDPAWLPGLAEGGVVERPAQSGAEQHPAVGEPVDGGEVPGELPGLTAGHGRDPGAQREFVGPGGDG